MARRVNSDAESREMKRAFQSQRKPFDKFTKMLA